MELNILVNNPGAKRDKKRLGRGIGSGKGKTCGRGVKGQKSRKGVAIKGFEGGQTPLIKRLAKRGFNCINRINYIPISIDRIVKSIEEGKIPNDQVITINHLIAAGIVKNSNKLVKLVNGVKPLETILEVNFKNYTITAKDSIERAGGKVV